MFLCLLRKSRAGIGKNLLFFILSDRIGDMLKPSKKSKIIGDYKTHENDTGSSEVQIAILTKQIEELAKHLKTHTKDNHSRRGLLKMVAKRKKLLDYLKKENEKSYKKVTKKLGLKTK